MMDLDGMCKMLNEELVTQVYLCTFISFNRIFFLVTFTTTPVGDASSRLEVPVQVAEDAVELLQHQPIAIQDVDN
jgi:hypothetical protein